MGIGEFYANIIQSSMIVTYGISCNVRVNFIFRPFRAPSLGHNLLTQGSELPLLTLGYVIAPLQGCHTHCTGFPGQQ